MEELGIKATLIFPRKGYRKIVLIKRIGSKWLVRFSEIDREIEVFEHEFVPD